MHCSSCSSAVEMGLSNAKGVEKAAVSLSLKMAEVTYDPNLVTEVFPLQSSPCTEGCLSPQDFPVALIGPVAFICMKMLHRRLILWRLWREPDLRPGWLGRVP